jgi:cell wall assembly regulator SMI1
MSTIDWKWVEEGAEKVDIKRIESKFNTTLPKDYVDLALKFNAGSPKQKYLKINSDKEYVFNALLNLMEGGDEPSLLETFNNIQDRLPDNIIPFGSDPFGNMFCFNLNDNPPTVCFWDHEIAHQDIENSVTNIATNFKEFLNLLK